MWIVGLGLPPCRGSSAFGEDVTQRARLARRAGRPTARGPGAIRIGSGTAVGSAVPCSRESGEGEQTMPEPLRCPAPPPCDAVGGNVPIQARTSLCRATTRHQRRIWAELPNGEGSSGRRLHALDEVFAVCPAAEATFEVGNLPADCVRRERGEVILVDDFKAELRAWVGEFSSDFDAHPGRPARSSSPVTSAVPTSRAVDDHKQCVEACCHSARKQAPVWMVRTTL